MKDKKRLNSLSISSDGFYFTDVNSFEIHSNNHKILINGEDYTLDDDLVIMCPYGQGELIDINAVDVLAVMGFNHTVHSIMIQRSHGYLRLEGTAFFVGGWIEVAGEHIYQIEDEMLLAVPVGTYDVSVSHKGCVGTETITVESGREYQMDISRYQGEAQKGKLIFTITPDDASVFIDNKEIDISEPVELEYGLHQMVIRADGYKTITKFIKVGSPNANVDITMEKLDDNEDDNSTVSSNSTSANSVSDNTPSNNIAGLGLVTTPSENSALSANAVSNNNASSQQATPSDNTATQTQVISTSPGARVYIDAPADAEVFVNGIYVGITPVSFLKKAGTCEIVIRRNGYESRAYTLEIDDSSEDVNYSFSELLEQTH